MDAIHCNYHDYGNRNRSFRLFMDYVANVIPFFGRNLTRIYFKLTQSTFAGAPRRLSLCRFRPEGKGLERETLCPFPRVRRFGTHCETGSKFLLLFSIKSKNENSLFRRESSKRANRPSSPSGILARLCQLSAKHCQPWRDCAQSVLASLLFLTHAPFINSNRRLRR